MLKHLVIASILFTLSAASWAASPTLEPVVVTTQKLSKEERAALRAKKKAEFRAKKSAAKS